MSEFTVQQIRQALQKAVDNGDLENAETLSKMLYKRGVKKGQTGIKRPQAELSWSEAGKSAIKNVPESGMKFFSDLWQAVRHPIETGKALGEVAEGAARLMVPGGDDPSEDMARAVGDFFADRYGSVKGFKETIATDPVGVLADLSGVLALGGATRGGPPALVGAIPALGKVARVASKAASVTDPITMPLALGGAAKKLPIVGPLAEKAGSAVGDLAAQTLGATTTAGDAPIKIAAEAGFAGGEKGRLFREALRGNIPHLELIDDAKKGLQALKEKRAAKYSEVIDPLHESKKILKFEPVDKAIEAIKTRGKYKDQVLDASSQDAVKRIQKIVGDWKKLDPAEYHTPMGMDALKRRIFNEVVDKFDIMKEGMARGTAMDVYHSVRKQIVDQAPEYGRAMKEYEIGSDLIEEITRSLSAGKKAVADTTIRKLTSVMRNNVNTNYGRRAELVKILDEAGAPGLTQKLAGLALERKVPRGLPGITSMLVGGLGTGIYTGVLPPAALLTAAAASPRVVGEVAHAAGRAAGTARKIAQSPIAQRAGRIPHLTAYQLGRTKEELKNRGLLP